MDTPPALPEEVALVCVAGAQELLCCADPRALALAPQALTFGLAAFAVTLTAPAGELLPPSARATASPSTSATKAARSRAVSRPSRRSTDVRWSCILCSLLMAESPALYLTSVDTSWVTGHVVSSTPFQEDQPGGTRCPSTTSSGRRREEGHIRRQAKSPSSGRSRAIIPAAPGPPPVRGAGEPAPAPFVNPSKREKSVARPANLTVARGAAAGDL